MDQRKVTDLPRLQPPFPTEWRGFASLCVRAIISSGLVLGLLGLLVSQHILNQIPVPDSPSETLPTPEVPPSMSWPPSPFYRPQTTGGFFVDIIVTSDILTKVLGVALMKTETIYYNTLWRGDIVQVRIPGLTGIPVPGTIYSCIITTTSQTIYVDGEFISIKNWIGPASAHQPSGLIFFKEKTDYHNSQQIILSYSTTFSRRILPWHNS